MEIPLLCVKGKSLSFGIEECGFPLKEPNWVTHNSKGLGIPCPFSRCLLPSKKGLLVPVSTCQSDFADELG